MKVYSYIKKNGFTPYLVVDSKTVGDRMNHDFSIQVQRGGASEEGVLVVQGNRNKTNPQVMEKLQNDIIADFPFLTKHNQSNPSQLVIKLAVDPKANVSESLNEHYIAGGIVGIGAITQIPSRAKTDYEMAFEHFLGERYETKFENREQDLKEGGDDEMPPAPSHEETDANQVYEMEGEDVMPKFRRGVLKQLIAYAEESGSSQEAIQDLKDALARIEAEIEAEKNKKPLNEGDLGELENQIISTFDNIENMPLDPAAKLQMAKFGLGLSLVKGLLEKVKQEGSAFSKPGSRERFQSFVSDIQNATSVEEVKQALLNVIQLANS